jgi:NAD(P)-dependent dehydrogenase (short-subunit alcohol dehydrogenase family)
MQLSNKVVVVTGGASGIGRAMARRFAADGARVVVADLDGAAAAAVADEIGGLGMACDVTREEQVVDLIARAPGPIDLFCANAGVAVGTDEQAPDAEWDLAFAVNVRAHVLAARHLVPAWLERGEGYFLATASAAGLLTQIGSAPYAVTKHAAVAFAEWLSITYGDRGIRVSCLCPMGVRTPMTEGDDLATQIVASAGPMLAPEDVAATVVEGLRDERFLILPHPEVMTFLRRKVDDHERWLAGMRRLQARVDGVRASGPAAPRPGPSHRDP